MVTRLIEALIGCPHKRTTFPMTRTGKPPRQTPYVVCLNCGREFEYDWETMRIGKRREQAVSPITGKDLRTEDA